VSFTTCEERHPRTDAHFPFRPKPPHPVIRSTQHRKQFAASSLVDAPTASLPDHSSCQRDAPDRSSQSRTDRPELGHWLTHRRSRCTSGQRPIKVVPRIRKRIRPGVQQVVSRFGCRRRTASTFGCCNFFEFGVSVADSRFALKWRMSSSQAITAPSEVPIPVSCKRRDRARCEIGFPASLPIIDLRPPPVTLPGSRLSICSGARRQRKHSRRRGARRQDWGFEVRTRAIGMPNSSSFVSVRGHRRWTVQEPEIAPPVSPRSIAVGNRTRNRRSALLRIWCDVR